MNVQIFKLWILQIWLLYAINNIKMKLLFYAVMKKRTFLIISKEKKKIHHWKFPEKDGEKNEKVWTIVLRYGLTGRLSDKAPSTSGKEKMQVITVPAEKLLSPTPIFPTESLAE